MKPHFQWTCSYLNRAWYTVTDETGRYEIEERRSACDYERSISRYDDAGWQREVVAAIGTIRRKDRNDKPIPPATVDAFNQWRAAGHSAFIAEMKARSGREPSIAPPPVVKGARFDPASKSIVPT